MKLLLDRTVVLEKAANICEMQEALREISPEEPDMDLTAFSFPLPEIRITEAAASWSAPVPFEAHPRDAAVAAKAGEITSRMTVRDKACLVVGARSAMAGEIVGVQAKSVPGAAGETVSFEKYGIPGMVLADGPAGVRISAEYEIDRNTGEILQPKDWFEMLEIRFFNKKIRHEPTCVTSLPPQSPSERSWPRASTQPCWKMSAPPLRTICGPSASPCGWRQA